MSASEKLPPEGIYIVSSPEELHDKCILLGHAFEQYETMENYN